MGASQGVEKQTHSAQLVPLEARAAVELVPGWRSIASEDDVELERAAQWGESPSHWTFKLSSPKRPAEAYTITLLRPNEGDNLLAHVRELSSAGLALQIVGSSQLAIVQRWLPCARPLAPRRWWGRAALDDLARFVARIHAVPIYHGAPEAAKNRIIDLRGLVRDVRGRCRRFGFDLDTELSKFERDLMPHTNCDLVLTHGNLHISNLLDSGGMLQAVGLEHLGPRPRECDLACLFMSLSSRRSISCYPSVRTRARFATEYLAECGLPSDESAVDELLFAVELRRVQEMFFEVCMSLKRGEPEAADMLPSIPAACLTLVKALSCPDARLQVLRQGVSAIASELTSAHPMTVAMARQYTSGSKVQAVSTI